MDRLIDRIDNDLGIGMSNVPASLKAKSTIQLSAAAKKENKR